MKNLFLLLLVGTLAFSLRAETSFQDLQSFTNMITMAHTKFVSGEKLLSELQVLQKAESNSEDKPSYERIAAAKAFTNAFVYAKEFDNMPPAIAIPLLFQLLENDALTNHKQVFSDGMYTNSFGEWVYQLIIDKMDIHAAFSPESITMLWVPKDTKLVNSKEFLFFWYYAGLKHLPTLWNDWYGLWKSENQREAPRPYVLERLSSEISGQFGYHLFPYVAEAIDNGDETLQPLLDKLPHDGGYHYRFLFYPPVNHINKSVPEEVKPYFPPQNGTFSNATSFVEWWEKNKKDFIFPQPKTKLADLKHIIKRQFRPNVMDETRYKSALELEKVLDGYCAQKARPTANCWYFAIKDEDVNQSE